MTYFIASIEFITGIIIHVLNSLHNICALIVNTNFTFLHDFKVIHGRSSITRLFLLLRFPLLIFETVTVLTWLMVS